MSEQREQRAGLQELLGGVGVEREVGRRVVRIVEEGSNLVGRMTVGAARWAGRLVAIVSVLLALCCEAQVKLPKRKRARDRADMERSKEWTRQHSLGLELSLLMIILCILPPIVMFFYNVAKDPATPAVLRNASEVLTERTLGFLSARGGGPGTSGDRGGSKRTPRAAKRE